MINFVKAFSNWLEENWDQFVTIIIALAALIISIIGAFGSDNEKMISGAILLALATITIGTLRDRGKLNKMENIITSTLKERSLLSAEYFFEPAGLDPYAALRTEMTKAKEIWILGLSNLKTITNYDTELQQALNKGAKVRILMLNPVADNPAFIMQSLRSAHPVRIETAMEHCQETCDRLSSMKLCASKQSKIDARGLNFMPGFGLIAIDPSSKNGKMRVKLYPYKKSKSEYPVFSLYASSDGNWYNFFLSQYESLWSTACPVKLQTEDCP